jgi:hypothetical protein
VTSKVVVKMNKLEGKLDQQVAVVKRQLESFRVHYLEGQKVGSQQASGASYQHQLRATQVGKDTEKNGKIGALLRDSALLDSKDCGSHLAVVDGNLAAASDTAGDLGNDCGSHPGVADGTLAAVCDAAGDVADDGCGSHPALADALVGVSTLAAALSWLMPRGVSALSLQLVTLQATLTLSWLMPRWVSALSLQLYEILT